jgi:KUP system potassium uptake protein
MAQVTSDLPGSPATLTHRTHQTGFWTAALGSVGVVFGDISTSPLYAFREAMKHATGKDAVPLPADVLGVLSLIIWALIIIVTIKYVFLLLRADNNGEGGTLSLMTLAAKGLGSPQRIALVGLVGAALFYGDSIITPAISVLSAVEGLKLATPLFEPYVLPITVVVLVVLFAVQYRGTQKVASFFGPIIVLWLVAIALLGVAQIVQNPVVLLAFNPYYAVAFIASHTLIAFITLGSVFLAVTGGEALYADLGHFGRRPIQVSWLALVLPALTLNYLGQGALVLADASALEHPFYKMVPELLLIPMVVLATAATVIASQAVITGAFSLSRQAVQLGFLPRLDVRHTHEAVAGQIYMPQINGLMLVGVLLLVIMFQKSDHLANAYGIAVTGTMLIDTVLLYVVVTRLWKWSLWTSLAVIGPLVLIELTFFGSNMLKVQEGGWVTLLVALSLILLMVTWRRGVDLVVEKSRKQEVPLASLIQQLERHPPQIVPGTAIFLTSQRDYAPTALLHTLKHFKVMHERVVIMSVETSDEPRVPLAEALTIEQLSPKFWRIRLTCGFMETPNIPKALAAFRKLGWGYDIMSTSFFLSRRSIKPATPSKMPLWQDRVFIMLANNAVDATEYFRIPKDRVVEVGTQLGI